MVASDKQGYMDVIQDNLGLPEGPSPRMGSVERRPEPKPRATGSGESIELSTQGFSVGNSIDY